MLWLCISLPQLPLEALCSNTITAAVVTAWEGNARWVICCNAAAERENLRAAMSYSAALAIHPQACTVERNLNAERSALERLAAWSYQFSSRVILSELRADLRHACTAALWLEIGASLKLFGGFRNLIEQLERELALLQYTYRLGIATTLDGAALLARAGIRVAITSAHALYVRIRNLPLAQLALDTEIIQQLNASGVRTIGALLELPRDAVARRFGPQTRLSLDRLMGEAPDPRPAYVAPASFSAHFAFEFEVHSTEALLFPIRRLLREFAGFLRGRDTGVQHFSLLFEHRGQPVTELRIGLSAPDRNADRFLALVREQLERIELPAATVSLRLSANDFVMPTALQNDLLSGELQQAEELSHTIDRLTARLGEQHVHAVRQVADHRPEYSWSKAPAMSRSSPAAHECPARSTPMVGIAETRDSKSSPDSNDSSVALQENQGTAAVATRIDLPNRPLWLLPEPRPLQLSSIPALCGGPERIETGWWDDHDVQRDYYILRTRQGPDLWVFRDLSDSHWYLHGLWG